MCADPLQSWLPAGRNNALVPAIPSGEITGGIDPHKLKGVPVLLADHKLSRLRDYKKQLLAYGVNIHLANSLENLLGYLEGESPRLLLVNTDLLLTERSESAPADLIDHIFNTCPNTLLYFYGESTPSLPATVELVKLGVSGVLSLPLQLSKLMGELYQQVCKHDHALEHTDPLSQSLQRFLLFRSAVMREGLSILPNIAAAEYPVLITGESGTGKELAAQAIHNLSPRQRAPFIAVNCGAIPESLIESELFGHEKGAFTGATSSKKGKFELASRGTLFLDEIGEMPLNMQVRLLRVLEERQLTRIGAEAPIRVNPRIIAATRVDLEQGVEDGVFREDLFFRLNVLRLRLPPIRERRDDIPLLAWHFLERTFEEIQRRPPYPFLTPQSLELLQSLEWRGNVRAIRNTMTRVALLLPPNIRRILPVHLVPFLEEIAAFDGLESTRAQQHGAEVIATHSAGINMANTGGVFIADGTPLKTAEHLIMERAVEVSGGNLSSAARALGISDKTLRRRKKAQGE